MMNTKKEMIKSFRNLGRRYDLYNVFFDFVKTAAIAISNTVDPIHYQAREQEYMAITKKYTSSEKLEFSKLLALLILELETDMRDVLGEVFMELGISSKDRGQFFTPWHTAKLMAELTGVDPHKTSTVCDPTVGGGVTIIAHAYVMAKNGINYQEQLNVYCLDIDKNVLLIAYVQLSLLGIKAICEIKDALANEPGDLWFTPFYVLSPYKIETSPSKNTKKEKIQKVITLIESEGVEQIEQLALF